MEFVKSRCDVFLFVDTNYKTSSWRNSHKLDAACICEWYCRRSTFKPVLHINIFQPVCSTCKSKPITDSVTFTGGRSRIFLRRGCTSKEWRNRLFLQNTSSIRKPQVISGGGGAHPLHPPPRSTPGLHQSIPLYHKTDLPV